MTPTPQAASGRAATGATGSSVRRRLLEGLRVRLAFLLAALFLVFYLVTASLIYGLTAQLTQNNVDAILGDTTRPLAARVVSDLDRGLFPTEFVALAKLAETYPKVSAIVLRDAQGNVIASTAPDVTRTLPYALGGTRQQFTTVEIGAGDWYRVLTLRLESPYRQPVGYLQMAMNVDHDRTSLGRLAEVLVLVGGLGLLFAAAAGFFLSRLWLRPAMTAWEQQERFVADASHELRTPLTVMRVNLDLVASQPDTQVAENAPWLQAIETEIGRLQRLSDQMLTLARTNGSAPARRQPVEFRSLVLQVVEAFQASANEKGLSLNCTIPEEDLTLLGDPDALYQLVAVVLDNAVKYTAAGSVDVTLKRHRHEALLQVRDTGIGIEPQHLERIFDRFYRTDTARSKASGGAGLGLAIAREVALAHRGQLSVLSTFGEGTTFLLTLPLSLGTS